MKLTAKKLLYCIYAIAAVAFFLFYLFPSEIMRDLLLERISQTQPDLHVTTQQVQPTLFPPGLRFKPLAVAYADFPILQSEHINIVPKLFSLLGDQKEFAFSGPLKSGLIKGHAELAMDAKRPQSKITLNLETVPLEVIEILKQWPQYQASGEMNAFIDYNSRTGAGGSARVTLDITPARIVFNPPVMGLEQMDFSQIQAELTVTPRMLQIRRMEAGGNQVESRLTGSIIFRQPLENSRLTLSCTIKPQPTFVAEHKNDMLGGLLASDAAQKRGVVFRISGTLGNPQYVIR